ncbi:Dihydrouridine synthase DuS [uncultured delta proteobacterium]|uniref:tRNA-dihydrouridine synthase n=1 Tax=uncultured delta proteobacterium TaxID=34034 RepID=A0A212KCD9_9DELT|nr:Dihydrouridine synthase DuS [uncultured delta proteobacterium]
MGAAHPSSPPGLPIGPSRPWLAPLAGYSDLPFRLLCRELGASVTCTEMVSAKGLVLGQGKKSNATNELLATWPPLEPPVRCRAASLPYPGPGPSLPPVAPDTPLVVQLFGAEASFMGEAVRILVDRGYAWFDCNMGCSVPKVVKSGSGAAMLQDPDNAVAVAEAMLGAAGKGRVGFKLRLGREAGEDVYLPLAKRLEEAGAGWLTLHPRYARQKFTGTADWDAVRPLVAQSAIPVMVSGDLFTPSDGVKALAVTGAAGVMFARGAMHNPAIFGQFTELLVAGKASGGRGQRFADASALEYCIRRHAALIRAFYPQRLNRQGVEAGLLKMRTFVPRYVKECAGARYLRRAMANCLTWRAMDDLLDDFFARAENLELAPSDAAMCGDSDT